MRIVPNRVINDAIRDRIASDATTLAPVADAVHVHLMKSAFSPLEGTAFVDTDEADFPGYAVGVAGVGAQNSFTDPVTGDRVVSLLEPAGGWLWKCTGSAPPTPQVISGIVVTDNADAVTYGSQIFPLSITITGIGDAVDLDSVELRFRPGFAG